MAFLETQQKLSALEICDFESIYQVNIDLVHQWADGRTILHMKTVPDAKTLQDALARQGPVYQVARCDECHPHDSDIIK